MDSVLAETGTLKTILALIFGAALAGFLWECLDVLNAVVEHTKRRRRGG
jgi:hypothetical protein